MDVSTLKILANKATDETNVRFKFFSSEKNKVLCSASTLEEIYECVLSLEPEIIKEHVCACDESKDITRDLGFWVHYILADTELSMKIYTVAERYENEPEKLKVELVNLLFTRLLNFSEIALIPD